VASDSICAVAVDEAHCAAEWGVDFRPAYLQIRYLRKSCSAGGESDVAACLGRVPFCAVTATATKEVKAAIVQSLGLLTPLVLEASFNRGELLYSVRYKEALASNAEDLDPDSVPDCVARDMAGFIVASAGQGIVYARKRYATLDKQYCELELCWNGCPALTGLATSFDLYTQGQLCVQTC
jgi:superfamily II DNA helicase RecQ